MDVDLKGVSRFDVGFWAYGIIRTLWDSDPGSGVSVRFVDLYLECPIIVGCDDGGDGVCRIRWFHGHKKITTVSYVDFFDVSDMVTCIDLCLSDVEGLTV